MVCDKGSQLISESNAFSSGDWDPVLFKNSSSKWLNLTVGASNENKTIDSQSRGSAANRLEHSYGQLVNMLGNK